MFEKVLIPTDFSKYAEAMTECVSEIPGVKEIVLLHVIARDPLARVWSPGDELKKANSKLEESKKSLEKAGLKSKALAIPAEEGEEYRIIQRVADDENASLVAMGARGRSIMGGILLGSVSTNVLRYGTHSLLIMRYKTIEEGSMEKFCSSLFSDVLLPTDFSGAGLAAIELVKKLKPTGNVHLTNVVARGESTEDVEKKVADAKMRLASIQEDMDKAGINATANVVTAAPGEQRTYGTGGMAAVKASPFVDVGGVAQKIISMAEAFNASLIAMSSHGKGWLDQLTVGSVVFDVARMGRRPILVVRSKKKA